MLSHAILPLKRPHHSIGSRVTAKCRHRRLCVALMALLDTYTMNRKLGSEQHQNVGLLNHSLVRAHVLLCTFSTQNMCVWACAQARVSRWAQKPGGHSTLHRLVLHVWANRASEPHVHKQSCARPSTITEIEQLLRRCGSLCLSPLLKEVVLKHVEYNSM